MSRDDILRMAREAGLLAGADLTSDRNRLFTAGLERFAALIAAEEREACAQSCVEISKDYWMGDSQFEAATRCANAIRKFRAHHVCADCIKGLDKK